jgi:hypothetical protein
MVSLNAIRKYIKSLPMFAAGDEEGMAPT